MFSCNICKQTFTTKRSWVRHLIVHTGVKFKCGLCPKSFSRKNVLNKHLKTKHSTEQTSADSLNNENAENIRQNSIDDERFFDIINEQDNVRPRSYGTERNKSFKPELIDPAYESASVHSSTSSYGDSNSKFGQHFVSAENLFNECKSTTQTKSTQTGLEIQDGSLDASKSTLNHVPLTLSGIEQNKSFNSFKPELIDPAYESASVHSSTSSYGDSNSKFGQHFVSDENSFDECKSTTQFKFTQTGLEVQDGSLDASKSTLNSVPLILSGIEQNKSFKPELIDPAYKSASVHSSTSSYGDSDSKFGQHFVSDENLFNECKSTIQTKSTQTGLEIQDGSLDVSKSTLSHVPQILSGIEQNKLFKSEFIDPAYESTSVHSLTSSYDNSYSKFGQHFISDENLFNECKSTTQTKSTQTSLEVQNGSLDASKSTLRHVPLILSGIEQNKSFKFEFIDPAYESISVHSSTSSYNGRNSKFGQHNFSDPCLCNLCKTESIVPDMNIPNKNRMSTNCLYNTNSSSNEANVYCTSLKGNDQRKLRNTIKRLEVAKQTIKKQKKTIRAFHHNVRNLQKRVRILEYRLKLSTNYRTKFI